MKKSSSSTTYQKAESLLNALAVKIQSIEINGNDALNDKLIEIHKMLTSRKIDEMAIANNKIDSMITKKEALIAQNDSFFNEIAEKTEKLTEGDKKNRLPFNQINEWVFQKNVLLDQESSFLDTQISQFSQKLDNLISSLESKKNDLDSLTTELLILEKENDRISKPDRSLEIRNELMDLQKQIDEIEMSAASLCNVKYSRSFDIKKQIVRFQTNLDQIISRIQTLSLPLPESESPKNSTPKAKLSQKIKSELTEIEAVTLQVENTVLELQNKLVSLQSLGDRLAKVKQLQRTAQLELQGEFSRLQKKEARENMIKRFADEKKNQKNRIRDNEKKIKEIKTSIKDLEYKKGGVLNQKASYLRQLDHIKTLYGKVAANEEKIDGLVSAIDVITPPSKIWENSINERIKMARREISLGNPLAIILFPRRTAFRFLLSQYIRKEVLFTEKELEGLGLLKKSYLEQIDVFHRKNRHGLQLCPEILSL
ncbi:hypothetical protein KJ966_11325 [bacterium]|nr:hypothetical protein [bacterium]